VKSSLAEGLPDYIGNAIVASENRTFYTDKGLDLKGIARAFINNVTKGTRQGGSTITQQYAERYYMGETTSYAGKAREAIMAIKIAQTEVQGRGAVQLHEHHLSGPQLLRHPGSGQGILQ
jgi:Transglycosylase